jgi:hypothetical protein
VKVGIFIHCIQGVLNRLDAVFAYDRGEIVKADIEVCSGHDEDCFYLGTNRDCGNNNGEINSSKNVYPNDISSIHGSANHQRIGT